MVSVNARYSCPAARSKAPRGMNGLSTSNLAVAGPNGSAVYMYWASRPKSLKSMHDDAAAGSVAVATSEEGRQLPATANSHHAGSAGLKKKMLMKPSIDVTPFTAKGRLNVPTSC